MQIAKIKKPNIFLCYRRDDSISETSRLCQDLVHEYGVDNVFMDIDSLPLGHNFPEFIQKKIISSSVILVVIGRNWLTISKNGLPRIADPQDHVRREISYALKHGKTIIPILVQNATLPDQSDLPGDIKLLSELQALQLNYAYWNIDLKKLKKNFASEQGFFSTRLFLFCSIVLLVGFVIFISNFNGDNLFNYSTRAKTSLNIHLYQLNSPNYNADILKFFTEIINIKNTSFNFAIHTSREIPSSMVDHEILQINDSLQEDYNSIHSDTILKLIRSIHPLENNVKQEVVIGLIPYSLHTTYTMNLFSAASNRYIIISTSDWNTKAFQPSSVYKYIIHQAVKSSLVSSALNKNKLLTYHNTDVTVGCLFDYHYEKTGIKNSLTNGIICKEHQQIIKEIYGEQLLKDFEFIVQFKWLDDDAKKKLKEGYNYII